MEINLWAKKGKVTISVKGDANPNSAPVLTVGIKDPQIVYDEATNKITITETK
jgi:hypothetical protein